MASIAGIFCAVAGFIAAMTFSYFNYLVAQRASANFFELAYYSNRLESMLNVLIGAIVFFGVTYLVYLPFIIMWNYRSLKNLRDNDVEIRWKTGWAIGGWFIPLAGYIIPPVMIRDIMRFTGKVLAYFEPEGDWKAKVDKAYKWAGAWMGFNILTMIGSFSGNSSEESWSTIVTMTASSLGILCFLMALKRFSEIEDRMHQLFVEGAFQDRIAKQDQEFQPEFEGKRPDWYQEENTEYKPESDVFQNQNDSTSSPPPPPVPQ